MKLSPDGALNAWTSESTYRRAIFVIRYKYKSIESTSVKPGIAERFIKQHSIMEDELSRLLPAQRARRPFFRFSFCLQIEGSGLSFR
jgi:hypothetical protein